MIPKAVVWAKRWRASWLAALVALVSSCHPAHYRIEQPVVTAPPPRGAFRAGAAEVDITPAIGYPVFGHSLDGAPRTTGYRGRLWARAIALEDARGERLALVSVDLGAVSGLLQRKVASQIASLGLSPARLMLAATHTHSGPHGYFGETFYNGFGGGRAGFDPQLLEFLASRIVLALERAVAQLEPARVGHVTHVLPGITRNRSLPAWASNKLEPDLPADLPEVDDRLQLLRFDAYPSQRPLAAFVAFAAHGTADNHHNTLYHGDLHGYAARRLETVVRARHASTPGPDFVAVTANGAEGDVSPAWSCQSYAEVERLGAALGDGAALAFDAAHAEHGDEIELAHAYREVDAPGASTAEGLVCVEPRVGAATLGGAEDGRSFAHGRLGIREGHRKREPEGCQSFKLPAGAFLQGLLVWRRFSQVYELVGSDAGPADFPRYLPFQAFRIGKLANLVTVPGEPTTVLGYRIARRIADVEELAGGGAPAPVSPTIVVGLANEYVGYFTTSAEYSLQHYEGASTFYGPLQGTFAEEQVLETYRRAREIEYLRSAGCHASVAPCCPGCSHARATPTLGNLYYAGRPFSPGETRSFVGSARACSASEWREIELESDGVSVVFRYRGADGNEACAWPPPRHYVITSGASAGSERTLQGDEDSRFVIEADDEEWTVTWWPPPGACHDQPCRLAVERPGMAPLLSREFVR